MLPKLKIFIMASLFVLSILSVISMGANAASSNLSYSPDVFSSGSTTLAVISGGSFTASSTVYFYISTTQSSSGIIGSYIGSYTLPSGATTLNDAHVQLTIPSIPSGNYYLLVSTTSSSSSVLPGGYQITVSYLKPTFSISYSQATGTASVSGYGWDPSSVLSLYTTGSSGTPLDNNFVGTIYTSSTGRINYGYTINMPQLASGSYTVIIQESSSSSPNYGITYDSSISVSPYITTSPFDISGQIGSKVTVNGYGFPSGAVIPSGGIIIGGVKTGSSVTANSYGTFSETVSLPSAITSTGPQTVTIQYNSSSYSQSNAIVISSPSLTNLNLKVSMGSTPNSPYSAYVYNFPSDSQVSFYLGSIYLGQTTTDSNGFASISGNVPATVAGTYQFYADSSGIIVSSVETISPYYMIVDPSGGFVSSEYFPSGGIYTVKAYGLTPFNEYQFTDSGASAMSYVISVSSGSLIKMSPFEFEPAINGTLIFTFRSFYNGVSSPTISLGNVPSLGGISFGYKSVTGAQFSLSEMSIYTVAKTVSTTVSNIIPAGSIVYPGVLNSYNIYIGNTEIQFSTSPTSILTYTLSSSTSSQSIYFTIPTLPSGVYNLSIYYSGAFSSGPISQVPIVISTSATSLNSGTVVSVPIVSGGQVTGYYIAGYGFYSSATVKLYYSTYTGQNEISVGMTYGAFVTTIGVTDMPSGSYAIYAIAQYGTSTYTTYSSYRVYSYLSLTTREGGIGSIIGYTMTGMQENSFYSLQFNETSVTNIMTNSYGYATGSFQVPSIPPGNYTVSVISPSGASVASTYFVVTPSATLQLTPGQYAFPGQIVQFSWNPSVKPQNPSTPSSSGIYYSPVYVTVYLNNSAYVTIQSGSYSSTPGLINGSFQMPNNNPGSYYTVTLSWTQYTYTIGTSTLSSSTTTETHVISGGNGQFIELISGNGALITGISQSQIAEISASVSNTINTAMRVPLSELNATIVSLNNDIVTINTAFGKMETTLSDINATLISVSNGIASIETSLGNIQASLKSINTTVTGINGGIISLQTTAGNIQTSINNLIPEIAYMNATEIRISTVAGMINYNLTQFSNLEISSIKGMNATVIGSIYGMNVTLQSSLNNLDEKVVSVGNNEVKIYTFLGTMNGNITNISNGIATIKTALGTMQTNVTSIEGSVHSGNNVTSNSFLLDIIMIVLIIITLIIATMAMMGTRDIAKMFGMKKE